jgi:hypothetical protein
MKVLCVTSDPILLFTERPRWHRTLTGGQMRIVTDCGVIQIEWEPDFYADGRSGGWGVDWLMPNVGTQSDREIWFPHDVLFYDFDISFESTNSIFVQTARIKKYPEWKVKMLSMGINSGIARRKFGNNTPGELLNKQKVNVTWPHK